MSFLFENVLERSEYYLFLAFLITVRGHHLTELINLLTVRGALAERQLHVLFALYVHQLQILFLTPTFFTIIRKHQLNVRASGITSVALSGLLLFPVLTFHLFNGWMQLSYRSMGIDQLLLVSLHKMDTIAINYSWTVNSGGSMKINTVYQARGWVKKGLNKYFDR